MKKLEHENLKGKGKDLKDKTKKNKTMKQKIWYHSKEMG